LHEESLDASFMPVNLMNATAACLKKDDVWFLKKQLHDFQDNITKASDILFKNKGKPSIKPDLPVMVALTGQFSNCFLTDLKKIAFLGK